MKTNKISFKFSVVPKSIWAIGCVTLLMNLSNITVMTLSPIYLTTVLGISSASIGVLEGLIEALSWFMRIFSGFISDYFHKRKPLLFFAYTCSALSRPLIALAPNAAFVFSARALDRIGNGLQATPREALVGDHAPPDYKGTCFGLRQTLGVVGSFVGAIIIYFIVQAKSIDYKTIFLGASIPPLVALIILYLFVKDVSAPITNRIKETFLSSCLHIKDLKKEYWYVIAIAFIFMISNYNGALMIIHATKVTQELTIAPQTMIYQNLATMLAAFPIGRLSDSMDRRILLAIGFMVTIMANILFGFAHNNFMIILGATLWGVQLGITQSLFMTLVADHSTAAIRGIAFGIYSIVVGLSLFLANSQLGWLFEHYTPLHGFMVSSVYVVIALVGLPLIKTRQLTDTAKN